MSEIDPLEDVLMNVALGDEDSVKTLTAHLRHLESGLAESQGKSLVQQQLQELEGRKVYLKKVLAWARQNPDVAYDDESYEHAVRVDANLAKAYPQMSEDQRLSFAADITREELGDPQERDYASAIRSMRAKRTGSDMEDVPADNDYNSMESQIERERSAHIAQIKAEREQLLTNTSKAYRIRKDETRRAVVDKT
jgi:hypothetical protein